MRSSASSIFWLCLSLLWLCGPAALAVEQSYSAKLQATPNELSAKIEGLQWATFLPEVVVTSRGLGDQEVRQAHAVLKGVFSREDTILAREFPGEKPKLAAKRGQGKFILNVTLTGTETPLYLASVGKDGSVQTESFTIVFPQWKEALEVHTVVISSRPNIELLLGPGFITAPASNFTMTTLRGQIGGRVPLGERWDLQTLGSGDLDAFSATPATLRVRTYDGDLRLGFAIAATEPWRFSLYLGGQFHLVQTGLATSGYSTLATEYGPEVSIELRHTLSSRDSLAFEASYAMLDQQEQQFGGRADYEHSVGKGFLILRAEYSSLTVDQQLSFAIGLGF